MELLRRISNSFVRIGNTVLSGDEVFYIGGSDTLPAPLTKEEEAEVMSALAAGDYSVRKVLIEHNLRLVVYIARKFENTGIYV